MTSNVGWRRVLAIGLAAAWMGQPVARAAEIQKVPTAIAQEAPQAVQPIDFTTETLPNGLQVIYAPLHQAPVVHVRVLYHVGSRDERPDRQGFAHMFEHMMFRGSTHVAPEQHMKLIGSVGGISNAFTSFDQTVYHDTLPADHLEMALYLEADRMAAFKVSEDVYKTERNVVAEEWRMKQNKPYGDLYEQLLKNAFTTHSYRWTPIGNMDHLRAAGVDELQEFFNTYYLPNNAVLVIAGDFDPEKTRAMVHEYFGWIPKGPDVPRLAQAEPVQTEARRADVPMTVPLPAVYIAYHIPPYKSDEQYALGTLAAILGSGNSSRLDRLLVSSADPLCVDVSAQHWTLEDSGMMAIGGTVMSKKDPAEVEKIIVAAVADVVNNGVTEEELAKARTQAQVSLIKSRETATSLAEQLGGEALIGGDVERVNQEFARIQAVTAADVKAVAKKYLNPSQSTTLLVKPDPTGLAARKAAAAAKMDTPVAPSTQKVEPRKVEFPADYPRQPPLVVSKSKVNFAKGSESSVDGVKVITMTDDRLPLANLGVTLRRGAHSDPVGKEGLASLTLEMLRRGAGGMSYEQINQSLDSRGIGLTLDDGGDYLRLSMNCAADQLPYAVDIARTILREPAFPVEEFEKLKAQTIDQLRLSEESPQTVAMHELSAAVYGSSPLGRFAMPASVASITLQDVKDFYAKNIAPDDAVVIFGGDVTQQRGQELAKVLLSGWASARPQAASYDLPATASKRKIVLVDRPDGKQATVRLGIRAYDIHTDEKFAGSVANQILTAGIESRLGKYVRAEKGLAYSVTGVFQPGRHGGAFVGGVDTRLETTVDAVEAMFHVFDTMRTAPVTPQELTDAQNRVAGGLVMQMQTNAQQSQYRVEGILNDYPIDYYDNYPARIAAVTLEQVQDAMKKYVHDDQMVVVVVAPAAAVKEQLRKLGEVEVIPMPAVRQPATKPASPETLKPAA